MNLPFDSRIWLHAAIGLLLCLGSGACDGSGHVDRTLVVRDSAGVEIVEVSRKAFDDVPLWTASPEPALRVGGPADPEGRAWHRLTGVALFAPERIAVATDASKQIMLVGSDGRTVSVVGRAGEGPGEFSNIRLIPSEDTNVVVAFDAIQERLTLLDSVLRNPVVVPLAGLAFGQAIPQYRYSNSDLLVRIPEPRPEPSNDGVVRGSARLLRMSHQGIKLVDYGRFPADDRVLRLTEQGGLTGGTPPFPRRLVTASVDSMVIIAPTGAFQLELFHIGGRHVRSLRVAGDRVPVTSAMVLAYRARVMKWATDPYATREWTLLSNDDVFPKYLPAFDMAVMDRNGLLWVRETPRESETLASWIVFTRSGQPSGRASLPSAFVPSVITSSKLYGLWNDGVNAEEVRVYDLKRTTR